jgi:alpha-tubulin suppressor-like RCC1 family protein
VALGAGCVINPGPPDPVSGLHVVSKSSETVTLSWDNPASAYWYLSLRRSVGTTPPSSPSEGTLVWDGNATTVTDSGLAEGTTYSYAVFAHGALGLASAPATLSVTVTPNDAIAAGGGHACALASGGTVRCWGSNSSGELGNGTTTNSLTPVMVLGISTATQIAASRNGDHSCALAGDGTVHCWGSNSRGQLGNGTTTNSSTPVTVSGISSATQVAVGAAFGHSCALAGDGTVRCWGSNSYGQLGNGTTTNSLTPVMVSGISTATQISAGGGYSCARLADSTVRCWGYNVATDTNSSTPFAVSGISTATHVSAGIAHACARLADGTLRCWGWNGHGELGNSTTTNSSTPVAVSGVSTATQVIAAGGHSCARLADGTLRCWGANFDGQLGNGTTTNSSTAVMVSGISTATQVTASGGYSCARLADGTVRCWGISADGASSSTPVIVPGIP